MKSYLETKKIIEKIESLVKKYDIDNEDFKQDLFLMLWTEKDNIESESSLNDFLSKRIFAEIEKEETNDIEIVSLDKEILDNSQRRINNRIGLKYDIHSVLIDSLTPDERCIIEEVFGIKQHSAAELDHLLSTYHVTELLNRAMEKLRNPKYVFLKEYM